MSADTSARELVVARLIKAPRELVFEAWCDPLHVSQWWGPRGFTTTTQTKDVRVGGIWRFVMHGPDGTDYPNLIEYTEVLRPERLCYLLGDDGASDQPKFSATITFDEQGGHTMLTLRMVCATVAQYETVKQFGALEGGRQTLERLEEYLLSAQAAA